MASLTTDAPDHDLSSWKGIFSNPKSSIFISIWLHTATDIVLRRNIQVTSSGAVYRGQRQDHSRKSNQELAIKHSFEPLLRTPWHASSREWYLSIICCRCNFFLLCVFRPERDPLSIFDLSFFLPEIRSHARTFHPVCHSPAFTLADAIMQPP